MARQVVFTSAPQGIYPNTSGYCTVLTTRGLQRTFVEYLEKLSVYRIEREIDGREIPSVAENFEKFQTVNPPGFSHVKFQHLRESQSVLIKTAISGFDYSDRLIKFSHFLALDDHDKVSAGPAWLCRQPAVFIQSWGGDPTILEEDRILPDDVSPVQVCNYWKSLTGDAGWAGVLAETSEHGDSKPAFVIYPGGVDPLVLLQESLALVPDPCRWDVTFSTNYSKFPPGVECQWRFIPAQSPEARKINVRDGQVLIDLTRSLGNAGTGKWANCARQGIQIPSPVVPVVQPAVATLDETPAANGTFEDDDIFAAVVAEQDGQDERKKESHSDGRFKSPGPPPPPPPEKDDKASGRGRKTFLIALNVFLGVALTAGVIALVIMNNARINQLSRDKDGPETNGSGEVVSDDNSKKNATDGVSNKVGGDGQRRDPRNRDKEPQDPDHNKPPGPPDGIDQILHPRNQDHPGRNPDVNEKSTTPDAPHQRRSLDWPWGIRFPEDWIARQVSEEPQVVNDDEPRQSDHNAHVEEYAVHSDTEKSNDDDVMAEQPPVAVVSDALINEANEFLASIAWHDDFDRIVLPVKFGDSSRQFLENSVQVPDGLSLDVTFPGVDSDGNFDPEGDTFKTMYGEFSIENHDDDNELNPTWTIRWKLDARGNYQNLIRLGLEDGILWWELLVDESLTPYHLFGCVIQLELYSVQKPDQPIVIQRAQFLEPVRIELDALRNSPDWNPPPLNEQHEEQWKVPINERLTPNLLNFLNLENSQRKRNLRFFFPYIGLRGAPSFLVERIEAESTHGVQVFFRYADDTNEILGDHMNVGFWWQPVESEWQHCRDRYKNKVSPKTEGDFQQIENSGVLIFQITNQEETAEPVDGIEPDVERNQEFNAAEANRND